MLMGSTIFTIHIFYIKPKFKIVSFVKQLFSKKCTVQISKEYFQKKNKNIE